MISEPCRVRRAGRGTGAAVIVVAAIAMLSLALLGSRPVAAEPAFSIPATRFGQSFFTWIREDPDVWCVDFVARGVGLPEDQANRRRVVEVGEEEFWEPFVPPLPCQESMGVRTIGLVSFDVSNLRARGYRESASRAELTFLRRTPPTQPNTDPDCSTRQLLITPVTSAWRVAESAQLDFVTVASSGNIEQDRHTADITSMVNGWLNGRPNHGVGLIFDGSLVPAPAEPRGELRHRCLHSYWEFELRISTPDQSGPLVLPPPDLPFPDLRTGSQPPMSGEPDCRGAPEFVEPRDRAVLSNPTVRFRWRPGPGWIFSRYEFTLLQPLADARHIIHHEWTAATELTFTVPSEFFNSDLQWWIGGTSEPIGGPSAWLVLNLRIVPPVRAAPMVLHGRVHLRWGDVTLPLPNAVVTARRGGEQGHECGTAIAAADGTYRLTVNSVEQDPQCFRGGELITVLIDWGPQQPQAPATQSPVTFVNGGDQTLDLELEQG